MKSTSVFVQGSRSYKRKCQFPGTANKLLRCGEGRTGEVIRFDDIVKGEISFETDGIGDFVIVKKDGTPTYNFAVAVDDYLMKMTHVLRGEDHISNTPKQIMI